MLTVGLLVSVSTGVAVAVIIIIIIIKCSKELMTDLRLGSIIRNIIMIVIVFNLVVVASRFLGSMSRNTSRRLGKASLFDFVMKGIMVDI